MNLRYTIKEYNPSVPAAIDNERRIFPPSIYIDIHGVSRVVEWAFYRLCVLVMCVCVEMAIGWNVWCLWSEHSQPYYTLAWFTWTLIKIYHAYHYHHLSVTVEVHTAYRLYAKTLHIWSPPLQPILPAQNADHFEGVCIKLFWSYYFNFVQYYFCIWNGYSASNIHTYISKNFCKTENWFAIYM